jgi:uncharacterized protein YjbI with pentapeptide repeats
MPERRFALIIANSEYKDPDLRRLLAPQPDAEALAKVLKDPKIGEFEVKVLLNEHSYEVGLEIEIFFDDRRPDDLLLLYFAGHGIKDEDGRLHYAVVNTCRKRLDPTSISADFVNKKMDRSMSRKKILLLDCCNSGAFARGMVPMDDKMIHTGEYFRGGRGMVVITASDERQYSWEVDDLLPDRSAGRRSIFTSALTEGLQGKADLNEDGYISYRELYDYAYGRVRDQTPYQSPRKWEFGVQGDISIAKNPLWKPKSEPVAIEPIARRTGIKNQEAYTLLRNGDISAFNKRVIEFGILNLTVADLRTAILTGADLRRADLRRADLSEAYLTEAILTGADLRRASLTGADLRRASLTGANISEANLTGAHLTWANLSEADLTGAYLTGADLRRANFTGVILTAADLSSATLGRADLRRADLREAYLGEAYLGEAYLIKAILSGANLEGALIIHPVYEDLKINANTSFIDTIIDDPDFIDYVRAFTKNIPDKIRNKNELKIELLERVQVIERVQDENLVANLLSMSELRD